MPELPKPIFWLASIRLQSKALRKRQPCTGDGSSFAMNVHSSKDTQSVRPEKEKERESKSGRKSGSERRRRKYPQSGARFVIRAYCRMGSGIPTLKRSQQNLGCGIMKILSANSSFDSSRAPQQAAGVCSGVCLGGYPRVSFSRSTWRCQSSLERLEWRRQLRLSTAFVSPFLPRMWRTSRRVGCVSFPHGLSIF